MLGCHSQCILGALSTHNVPDPSLCFPWLVVVLNNYGAVRRTPQQRYFGMFCLGLMDVDHQKRTGINSERSKEPQIYFLI